MAQPPLTVAIKKIEAELGVKLVERSNKYVRLTEAGQVFLEEGLRVIAQSDRAIAAAKRAGAGFTGRLRVTFLSSVAHNLLPKALHVFGMLHPNIQLTLTEATTGAQVRALIEDRSDLGILMPPVPDAADKLQFEVLKEDGLLVALPAGHPLTARCSIELRELESDPWILCPSHEGPGLYARITNACATAGFKPRIAQEAMQMDTMIGLVSGGLGIALVPRPFAETERSDVVFRDLSGVGTPVLRTIAAGYKTPSPMIRAFIDILHQQAAK